MEFNTMSILTLVIGLVVGALIIYILVVLTGAGAGKKERHHPGGDDHPGLRRRHLRGGRRPRSRRRMRRARHHRRARETGRKGRVRSVPAGRRAVRCFGRRGLRRILDADAAGVRGSCLHRHERGTHVRVRGGEHRHGGPEFPGPRLREARRLHPEPARRAGRGRAGRGSGARFRFARARADRSERRRAARRNSYEDRPF